MAGNLDTLCEAPRSAARVVPLGVKMAATLLQKTSRKTASNVIGKEGAPTTPKPPSTLRTGSFCKRPQPGDKPMRI